MAGRKGCRKDTIGLTRRQMRAAPLLTMLWRRRVAIVCVTLPPAESPGVARLSKNRIRTAAALLLLACAEAGAAADAPEVRVQIRGAEVLVEASLFVPASREEVWAVITDYDSAPQYISDLEKSVTLSRKDNVLVVSQKGTKGFGPFRISVESVKEIRLTPYEKTESRGLGGSMKKYAATTRLVAQGAGTLIQSSVYRSRGRPITGTLKSPCGWRRPSSRGSK